MKKSNDGGQLRLDSFMETRDPKIKRYYFDALEEEGPGGCERALLRTALYFKNLVPKKMHGPLIRECREAGIVV